MPNLQMPEIILLVLVVVLLFGAKKLPDTARGLGRSLRIFKAETKGLRDDDTPEGQATAQSGQPTPQSEPRQLSATETGATPAPPPAAPAAGTPAAPATPAPAAEPERDTR
ncbi:MAG: Sec-independent protein translocase subunit TatA [Actinomycetes bacterium]